MGLNRLESITANLIKAGMRADMPVAVVGRATLKDEWRNVATLNTIAAMVAAQDKPGPAVVLVGEAIGVALATALPLLATQAA
jgi:siroheme synthase